MNIVLLRHATRSAFLEFGQSESSLNDVGRRQAEALVAHVQPHGRLPVPTQIFSSPKLRARQTVEPLSKALKLPVTIMPDLDERGDTESAAHFEQRLRALPSKLIGETIFLCTHLDVLEAASILWPTTMTPQQQAQAWSTLEYQEFTANEGVLEPKTRGRVSP